DLGVSVLGEDPLRLDDRLDDDRVGLARGHANALASQHLDRHRVAIGAEVPIEGVRLADGERDGAQEVEERAVVERVADAWLLRLAVLAEDGALREDLEVTLDVSAALVEILPKPQGVAGLRVDPALVAIVDAIEEGAAAHREDGVPRLAAADVLH